MNAISLKNVFFDYNGLPVLSDVSLEIGQGAFAGLIGPNGGGKSTLLKLILGLLEPKSGTVELFGEDASRASGCAGYVPQFAGFRKDFPISALDCVALGGKGTLFCGWEERKRRRARAAELLEQFDLADLAKHRISALSGGQLQRVLIARALMGEPKILLMDEPTANVDSHAEHCLFETLRELNRTLTILLVSHDVGFISDYVSEVFCLNRRLVSHPTTAAEGDLLRELYGEDPMRQILHGHWHAHGHEHGGEDGR